MSTFKKGNKYHNYFVEKDKMMLSKDPPWKIDGGDGKGDALWRTSLAYMTWKLPDMKEGILGCFRKFDMIGLDKYWYQASRYTGRYKEDDVSRDQTLLAFSALKVNGDQEELNEILNYFPYRISRRFIMTPTMWVWTYSLRGNRWADYFCSILALLEVLVSVSLNKIFEPMLGFNKSIDQRDYQPYLYQDKKKGWNKVQKFMYSLMWPGYAQHLMCWHIYTTGDNIIKRWLETFLLKFYTEDSNLLFRLLCRDKTVTLLEIENYKPMTNWRWQVRLDGSASSPTEIKTDGSLDYNQMDKDLIKRLYGVNNI